MLSSSKITQIVHSIQNQILPSLGTSCVSVFLCGKRFDGHGGIREIIGKELSSKKHEMWLDVYYPEDIFDELLQRKSDLNLLHLENLLARSVHAIVIIVESAGSFTELGAFANTSELRDKLIVLLDRKYKKDKSFINMGPIKYLREQTKSQIYYLDFAGITSFVKPTYRFALHQHSTNKLDTILAGMMFLYTKLRTSVRQIAKQPPTPVKDISNPIYAQNFILACLYVFDKLEETDMRRVLDIASNSSSGPTDHSIILSAAKNILIYHKSITRHNGEYHITQLGLARLNELILRSQGNKHHILNHFDTLRIQYLNSVLRHT